MLPPTAADPTSEAPPRPCATHPDRPALAACATCGAGTCVECASVDVGDATRCPACRAREAAARADEGHPWDRRAALGLPRAALAVVRGVILTPRTFFARRPTETSLVSTLGLGFACFLVGQLGVTAWDLAFLDQTRRELEHDPLGAMLLWTATPEFHLAQLALAPLAYLVGLGSSAAFWWLGLKAVGALDRGFREIVRALALCQATSLLLPLVAPLAFLGPAGALVAYAFGLWALGVQVLGVSRLQGVPPSRGALALLVWMGLALGLALVLLTVVAGLVATQVKLPLGGR